MVNLQDVATALSGYGLDSVTFEWPGYIHIETDGALWAVGTANGVLAGDYYEDAEAFVDGYSPDSTVDIPMPPVNNPHDIAAAIYSALCAELR